MPPRITTGEDFRPLFIKEWREYRNLSQDRLVDRALERLETFSKSSLSRLENGKQPYSQPIMETLAWALNCEPQHLFSRPKEVLEKVPNEWAALIMAMDEQKRAHALKILRTFGDSGENKPDDRAA